MVRAEREGLTCVEHFYLWADWRALGGMNLGVSLEAMLDGRISGALVKDFKQLNAWYAQARQRQRALDKEKHVQPTTKRKKPRRRR